MAANARRPRTTPYPLRWAIARHGRRIHIVEYDASALRPGVRRALCGTSPMRWSTVYEKKPAIVDYYACPRCAAVSAKRKARTTALQRARTRG